MSEDNIAEMRKTIERLSKENAGLKADNGSLAKTVRTFEAEKAFTAQGYKAANGALYAAINPEGEITPEAVLEFANEQGFSVQESNSSDDADSQKSASNAAKEQADFSSMAGSGSRGGDGGSGGPGDTPMTRQAWKELHARDPEAARAAARQGRVQISRDNSYAEGHLGPGAMNPFEAFTQES